MDDPDICLSCFYTLYFFTQKIDYESVYSFPNVRYELNGMRVSLLIMVTKVIALDLLINDQDGFSK